MLIAPGWVVADREYWYPRYSQALPSGERVDQGDYCISRFKRPSNAQDLLETYISMGEEQDSVAFSRTIWAKIGKIASVHVGQYCKIVTLLPKRIALPSGHNAISHPVNLAGQWNIVNPQDLEKVRNFLLTYGDKILQGVSWTAEWLSNGLFCAWLKSEPEVVSWMGCLVSLVLSCVVLVDSSSFNGWSKRTWL